MVENAIKEHRVRAGLTQKQLADAIKADTSTLTLSVLESGKALPTRPYLDDLCDTLHTTPTDLYNSEDLDLLGSLPEPSADADGEAIITAASDRDHTGLVEFRTWLKPHEKKNIEAATAFLGYRSMAEWFRESYRTLYQRMVRVQNTPRPDNWKE